MLTVLQREFVYLWYYFDLQLRQIFPYWMDEANLFLERFKKAL